MSDIVDVFKLMCYTLSGFNLLYKMEGEYKNCITL